MNKKAFLGLVFSIVVIMAAMAYLPFPVGPVGAQDTGTVDNELRGWAWSDSTGWVSFNHEGTDGMSSSGGTSSGSTEYKMPSSATNKTKASGSLTWVNPAGSLPAPSTGVAVASVSYGSQSTNYLENRGFGLSLPAGAKVTGIEVCYERSGGARILEKVYEVYDEEVRLIKPDGSYSRGNKSQSSPWDYAPEGEYHSACYGGSNDTWGENWTPTDIASPNFGTTISAYLSANDWILAAKIDGVKVKVYYEESAGSPAPGGSDYAVIVDQNENLTGYAWSLNLGWIKFAPELYPTGVCGATNDCYGAKIVEGGTIDEVKGWARVCSVYQSGCSGTLRSDAELGGWDGWIRMHNVKRQANGGYFGYAWGDLNLAWLDLGFGVGDDGSGDEVCDPTEQVCGGGGEICDPDTECCPSEEGYPDCNDGDSQVSVVVNSECGSELGIEWNPSGDECGEFCRSYSQGEGVEVTISGTPEGSNLIVSGDCNSNPCVFDSIDGNKAITVSCPAIDISDCQLKLTGGSILQLIEDSYLDYNDVVLSDTFAKISLININTNAACGVNYDLSSQTSDSNVSILCESGGTYGSCNGLNGSGETKIKARFMTRPDEANETWNVIFVASSGGVSSLPKSYNSLIRYYRRIGN